MTDEEFAQLNALLKKYEPKDKDRIVKTLDDTTHEVYQQIHDVGHSAATQKIRTDEVVPLQTKLEKANTDLQALKDKAPDSAQLKREYDERENQLKEAHKTELQGKDTVIAGERLQRAQLDLAMTLHNEHNVDLDFAKLIVVQRPDVVARIKPGDGMALEVLQAGKTIAIAGASREEVLKHFAKELEPTIEKKWKNSRVRRGSNTDGSEGGDEGGDGNVYDKVRKEAKERQEAKSKNRREDHPARQRLRLGTDD